MYTAWLGNMAGESSAPPLLRNQTEAERHWQPENCSLEAAWREYKIRDGGKEWC